MDAPQPELRAGDVVSGRYRLVDHLGAGSTATVWRARDLDLGRDVALKVLLGSGVDPDLAARFQREGVVLARLNHPNVVPVLASGVDEGRPYLVMELIDGQALDTRLREGRLPVDDALDLVADVAAGLGAAHRAGVIHRDVKPANIVCDQGGVPRLVDFGIARVSDMTSMTRAHTVLGTAHYLSPEQARGEQLGPESDVYALGCVLFALLTGAPPFEADSHVAVAYRHVHDEPPAPSTLRPEVPAEVDAIVLRCLAKWPAGRYPTASDLETDLRRVRAGEPLAPVDQVTASIPVTPVAASGATMVLPAVAAAEPGAVDAVGVGGGEVIDRSPLVEATPSPHRPWGVLAAVAAGLVVLAFLLSGFGGADPLSTPPAPIDFKAITTTTTTVAVPATTAPPVTAVRQGKGKHGKRD
jgi:serine/threonine-protein kinase